MSGGHSYSRGCRCVACRAQHAAAQRQHRARRRLTGLPADDPRHGRATTYTNWGCLCPACLNAWREACADRREQRAVRLTADDPRHGKDTTYTNHGCRCVECRAAHTEAGRRRKAVA